MDFDFALLFYKFIEFPNYNYHKKIRIKIYKCIYTPTLIYPSQISHITNVFFPPDFEEVPDPGIEVWDVVRGNGVIDILGWLNSFAVGFLELAVVFWKNIKCLCHLGNTNSCQSQ